VTINFKTGNLKTGEWAIKCVSLTKSGAVSRKQGSSKTIFFAFCPFCGARLREPAPEAEDR